jgi:phage-related protein
MSFYARNFVFDKIPGEQWGLTISSTKPEDSSATSSDVKLLTETIYRRSSPFFYGVQQEPVLTFDIELNSEKEIDAVLAPIIERKLFGQMNYKKLQIMAPDYDQYYWNCFLTSPKIKRVGGMIVGYDCTVTCDAPWAWSFPRTTQKVYTPPIANIAYLFNNQSGNNDYMYPTITVAVSNIGGNFSIKNSSDSNRIFTFTGLSSGETIEIDNSHQIIKSSSGQNRLPNFNKKWMRFVPGRNDLVLSGNISTFAITYQNAQKIGG